MLEGRLALRMPGLDTTSRRDDHAPLDAFLRRRDEASFRRLYRRETPRLFALAARLAGSRADAEELTQETWVRAVTRLDDFRGDARLSTWLAGILINCFREGVRRQARQPLAPEEPMPVMGVDPAPSTIDLERALAQLPPGYREVVVLHDLFGYTHEEIADMLQIRPGTSKSQLKRGRERLRGLLTESEDAS